MVGDKEFYRKKITQTEYRGSRYSSRHEKETQFLNTELQPVSLDPKYYNVFQEHILKQLTRFLSKVVPEAYVSTILTESLLKKLYKLLRIK